MTDVNLSQPKAVRVGRWRVWAVMGVVVLVVAGIGFAAWRHIARPVDARLEALVGLLATDPTVFPPADARDVVKLPDRFAGVTPHGEMFLVRRGDGSFLAMFPTYYGSGTTIACLLYTSRPLRTDDTYVRQATLGKSNRVIDVASYQHMKLDDRIDDHWYRVSYGID